MILAVLFADSTGPYRLPFADLWDESRDARLYTGSLPVVAHPPCARWGRLAEQVARRSGQPQPGEDGGCFASAIGNVRRCGGVLEHPEGSAAWAVFGLVRPGARDGQWTQHPDRPGEWCAYTEQSAYGHVALKPSWIYFVGARAPAPLQRGGAPSRFVESLSSSDPRRWHTPMALALLLCSIALAAELSATGPALLPYRRRNQAKGALFP